MTSVIGATRKLAVALTATVLAVIIISAVTISVAVQGKNEADDRAKQALAQVASLQAGEKCKSDLLWQALVVAIHNYRTTNKVLIAHVLQDDANEEAAIAEVAANQEALDALTAAGFDNCAPPPSSSAVPPTTTTTG